MKRVIGWKEEKMSTNQQVIALNWQITWLYFERKNYGQNMMRGKGSKRKGNKESKKKERKIGNN